MAGAVGRYELVRAIGRGGMAEVFLARRRGAAGIAKRLVVKRVRQDLTSDPRFAEMFLREARVATLLSHTNIVTVFDVGRDDDGLFLAMDYVDGPDLGAVIERASSRERRLDPLLCAHIAAEVAAGLDHAHRLRDEGGTALGLVHRDVTPRNILLSQGGEVKVTDFGVAMLGGDGGADRRGTVPYMSPEQARGEPVDARADLFSLGLVLHELVTGRRVHGGSGRDEQLERARAGTVPPLEDAPAELTLLVARATATRREERFESARVMQRELVSFAMAERGRRGQSEPPEHLLAAELAELFPDWSEHRGEDAGLRPAGAAGVSTLRSVAETVGPEEPAASSPGVVAPPAAAAPTVSGRRIVALTGVAGVALAGVVGFALLRRGGGDERAGAVMPATLPADAGAAVSGTAAAPDAAPDATPATSPTPDAGPPPARPDAAPPRPTRKHPATAGAGFLDLNVVPWAYVSIDGGPEEETPIRGRSLAAGTHLVRIRNPVLDRKREMSVRITPGETSRHVVDLR